MVNVFALEPENLPKTPRLPLPGPEVGTVPLVQLEDGSVRFAGTKVSFDSIVYLHKQGRTTEQINASFDLVSIEDIEKAIAYYESERFAVNEYLEASKRIGEAWRELSEARSRSSEWKAHLEQSRALRKQPV